MRATARELCDQAGRLFSDRMPLVSLWQEIADHFYPERADFTASRNVGTDFASHLSTSYPILARRDMGNAFSTMLRTDDWFQIETDDEDTNDDTDARRWLERSTKVLRRAMYDRVSAFVRATKEADHDFAAFGQAVISTELSPKRDHLVYRCWHLRDVVWCENYAGEVDTVYRKWKPKLRQAVQTFGLDRLSATVRQRFEKEPYCDIEFIHVVMPGDMYEGERKFSTAWVSIWIETETYHVVEEVGVHHMAYSVPRWQTVSGSQYANSPATVCALPDARLIQSMTLTLLEAGEKAVNPPMVAVREAIRQDISLFAGGVTWVDAAYDERLGEVLRPLSQDKSGLPWGQEVRTDTREMIAEAFFLSKLSLPMNDGAMTAYEVSQRVEEYIRNARPLFEPMEQNYNGALCESTFNLMMANNGFGPLRDIPQSLSDREIKFKFASPLSHARGQQAMQRYQITRQLLADAVATDPAMAAMVRVPVALRDVMTDVGVPAEWIASEEEIEAAELSAAQQQQQQQLLATLGQGAAIAKDAAQAQALTARAQ